MYRFGLLLLSVVVGAFPKNAAAPVIACHIYAPVQKDSPVHIVGLRYDYPHVEIDLENASDVPVNGIGIFGVAMAPKGCGAEPRRTVGVADTQVRPVRIGPRQAGAASGTNSSLDPGFLVVPIARHLKASYLHVQVGIAEVDFADGTKWKLQTELFQTLLDASLVHADDGKCPDVARANEALTSIQILRPDRSVAGPSYGDPSGGTPAPLYFSCRLEGSNAYCPAGQSD